MTAVYARQSVARDESISIETQIERCRREAGEETVQIFCDRGYSGKNILRPGFSEMMERIETGMISRVIVYRLDRISRSVLDFCNMWEVFVRHGVRFVSCCERFDTSTAMGEAMLKTAVVFAELERRTIQQRVADNYYERAAQGFYLGGRPPFGYQKGAIILHGKKTACYEPDESVRRVVCGLFEDYAWTDMTLGKLAQRLNESAVLTGRGQSWTGTALGRLLRSPVYVRADADVYRYYRERGAAVNHEAADFAGVNGCYLYRPKGLTIKDGPAREYVTLAPHEGLVASVVWLRCQQRLGQNRRIGCAGSGSHTWLSGLLKCGYCGYGMTVVNNNRGHNYLTCYGRKQGLCRGRKRAIHLDTVENAVLGEVFMRLKGFTGKHAAAVRENPEINRLHIEELDLEEKIADLKRKILLMPARAAQMLGEELIRLDTLRENARARAERLGEAQFIGSADTADGAALLRRWREAGMEEHKQTARVLIEKVVVTDGRIEVFFW